MAPAPPDHRVHQPAVPGDGSVLSEASDGHLLEYFLAGREERAFAALMRRHGPMVLGVSRRVLRQVQDAEDVSQATFLLLARKAASIRKGGSLAGWLCRVAYRLALRARAQDDRRRDHERRGVAAEVMECREASGQEVQAALDAALGELPQKYRSALVLCYLEGKSHQEAARLLGCPLATLRTWMARGRAQLRSHLTEHGPTRGPACRGLHPARTTFSLCWTTRT
jgi:RNA polymerase sigma factor (sigma-70 family)